MNGEKRKYTARKGTNRIMSIGEEGESQRGKSAAPPEYASYRAYTGFSDSSANSRLYIFAPERGSAKPSKFNIAASIIAKIEHEANIPLLEKLVFIPEIYIFLTLEIDKYTSNTDNASSTESRIPVCGAEANNRQIAE
jgi:hypothetical protein